MYTISLCASECFMGFAPSASTPSTAAGCTVAPASLPTPTCWGPNGQSNGCVSFSNYPEFLNAFLKGEVTRLAVVERLESPPGKLATGQLPDPIRDPLKATDSRQYAAAANH